MAATTRAVRSDGVRSRREILQAAAMLATVRGIDQLSIGELATEVGMSKSGLYAHFGSKEELQLATIATANDIFEAEVLEPARATPPGRDGLIALSDAFLDHLRRRVFPGGCFFDAVAADLHGRSGTLRDAIAAFHGRWNGLIRQHLVAAVAAGDLPLDTDIDQLAFDVIAFQLFAHTLFTQTGDERALERSAVAIRTRLGAAPGVSPGAVHGGRRGRAASVPVRQP